MPKRYKLLKEVPGAYVNETIPIGSEFKWDKEHEKYVAENNELVQFHKSYCEDHPDFFEEIDIKYRPKKSQKYYFLKLDYGHFYIDEDWWGEEYRHRRRHELGIVFRTFTKGKDLLREVEELISNWHDEHGE